MFLLVGSIALFAGITYCLAISGVLGGKKCECDTAPSEPKCPLDVKQLHVCAFHIAKDDPKYQLNTHHYCCQVSPNGLHQCTIYDDDNKRLIGVEYIVPDELYQKLPEEEKKLWHPHYFEITQGLLLTPDVPEKCEKKCMDALVHSWGKTWQTWPDTKTDLPLGMPRLMWSALKDGDIKQELIDKRDKEMGIHTPDIKKSREWLIKTQKTQKAQE